MDVDGNKGVNVEVGDESRYRMAITFRFLYFLEYVPITHHQREISTGEAGMPRTWSE